MNSSQSLQDLTSGLNDEIIVKRYMPFIDTVAITSIATLTTQPMDPHTCRVLSFFAGWMDLTGIALTEIVLTIRTWVLWKKNIKLSFGLPLFYICCWIPILYALNRYLQSQTCCVYSGGQSILYLCWAFLTVYEIVYLGHWSELTKVIYRDGIIYYIFLFAWSAINLGTSISLSCFLIYDIITGHLT
ncbi:hypothetical protein F5878DRAFT_713555 [Lentinula raphanica]|uniref:Uncharacterized protein n=1 Tax=Lentinula raphanica TaxID=153919 RepID=A0AA38U5K8_9AGAR|nr:hypothetical protein F5878DRAFT_713555 [Lentinula raphanica]